MGSEASSLMVQYFNKMHTDPTLKGDAQRQTKIFGKIFKLLDKDGNGTIDNNEIPTLMKELKKAIEKAGKRQVTENEVQHILRVSDKNKDGEIDFQEFCGMMFAVSMVCFQ